jgi:hypothetical protein
MQVGSNNPKNVIKSPHEESRNSRQNHSNNRDKRNSRDSSKQKRHQQQLAHQQQHHQQQQRRPLSQHEEVTTVSGENTEEIMQNLEPYDVLFLQDQPRQPEAQVPSASTPDVAMESQYIAHRMRQSGGGGHGSVVGSSRSRGQHHAGQRISNISGGSSDQDSRKFMDITN